MNNSSLNTEIVHTYKWYKKLTGRFLNIALFQTITIIILTLISQVLLLLSTMTPLKVIMLLASPNIPGFFPTSWQSLDRDILILYLAIASVGFFILHLLCEKVIHHTAFDGSNKILQNNKKVILFEKQDIFAQKSYNKLAKSLSNLIFFLLSLVGLMIVYLPLSMVIVFYVFSIYMFFFIVYYNNNLANILNEKFNSSLDILRGMGFFIVFAFILGSFLLDFYPPKTLIIVLSIILARQMFSKLSSAIKDIKSLYKDRLKINSLFFFKDTTMQLQHDRLDPFWSILKNGNREKWMQQLLDDIFEGSVIYVSSQWYRLNYKNIAFFEVIAKKKREETVHVYLMKLFNKNISSQAIHEATILQENIQDLPCLPYIGSSIVEEFHCNIFEYSHVKAVKDFNNDNVNLRMQMMQIKPSKELVDKYSRSHPYLYKRLNKKIFEKLYLVANENELEMINTFEKNFDDIVQKVAKMPKQIINPMITKFSLVTCKERFALLHWGGWKIDSLGVDFPVSVKALDTLRKIFSKDEIKIDDVILVALISHFEKLCNGENFSGIFETIPKILKCVENEI